MFGMPWPWDHGDFYFWIHDGEEGCAMDDTATKGAPIAPDDGQLFHLVTRTRVPRTPHTWGAQKMVAKEISPSGHEQREWACEKCAIVRITVMPADGSLARREWRFGNGCQFIDPCGEPSCGATEDARA